MGKNIEVKLNKNTIIVLDNEEQAVELCTQEYFKGNDKTEINGRKFDIFNFGNFDFRKKSMLMNWSIFQKFYI